MNRFCLSALILFVIVLFPFSSAGICDRWSFDVGAGASDIFVHSAGTSSSIEKYVNLVNNSGFEEGLEAWDLRVGRGAEIDVAPSVSHSGNQSLMIKRTDYGYGYVTQRFDFGNITAKNFLVGGWARSEETSKKYHFFDLLVKSVYEDGDSGVYSVEFSHGTHDWEFRSLSVSLNESKRVNYIILYVRFQETSGTVWFDDISLIWVDAGVRVRCVDESSANLVNTTVQAYLGLEFFGEGNTDENGTVEFLLSANNTYSFVVYWRGLVVYRVDGVEVLNDVDLLFSCSVSFEMATVSLFLKDFLGQALPSSEVRVRFRPLTATQDFLDEELVSDLDGKVEFYVPEGGGEMRVLFFSYSATYETRRIVSVNSNVTFTVKFDFLKFGGFVVSVRDFFLYSTVLVFLGAGAILVLRDVYKWRKKRG